MPQNIQDQIKRYGVSLLFAGLYLCWALAFIYHSSYVAADGRRYFNLFDDAMISMRYAWNFSHGNGLVWNVGERVEGYTNLLMTLWMAVATFLFEKSQAVLFIQVSGIIFILGSAFFSIKILDILGNSNETLPRYLLLVMGLFYYPLTFWSLMGMETGLLAFLISAAVLCSILYVNNLKPGYLWGMSLCFGLAYLTRNESILFAALAFAYLLPAIKSGSRHVGFFLLAGGLYAVFVVGQLVFRYAYYGEWVPNTYTLKLVGMSVHDRLVNGWGFILPFLQENWLLIILALAGTLLKLTRHKAILFTFFLTAVLYQIYVGGDAWPYWRITAPAMPLLFVLIMLLKQELNGRFRFISNAAMNVLLVMVSLAGLYLANARFINELLLQELPYQNDYARAHVDAAIALTELTEPGATVGVFWAGSLPYYVDRPAIDFLGKSDKYIANLKPDMSGQSQGFGMISIPGHNKYDLNYSIKGLMPTYVEEFDRGDQILTPWAKNYYVRVKYKGAKLYLLKDSPQVHWEKIKTYLVW